MSIKFEELIMHASQCFLEREEFGENVGYKPFYCVPIDGTYT